MSKQFIIEKEKKIEIIGEYELICVGGGMTGVCAALSAARAGISTLLIESKAFLGGVGTMGLPIQGLFDMNKQRVITGVPEELLSRISDNGSCGSDCLVDCEMHNTFLIVDPEMVKLTCQEMLLEDGVDIMLHTNAVDAFVSGDSIEGVFIENKSGRKFVRAKILIDCTGDGDIAASCGIPFTFGREEAGIAQASTLMFRLDNVKLSELVKEIHMKPEKYDLISNLRREKITEDKKHILVGLRNLVRDAEKDGFKGLPWDRVCYITGTKDCSVYINMVHVNNKSSIVAEDLTRIEIEGRNQIPGIVDFMRKYVPGFQNAFFSHSAAWSGIRESRHIQGEYILSEDDLKRGFKNPDTVVIGAYPIDIHFSGEDGIEDLEFNKIEPYGIPYGVFLPKKINNLLVAGRCISATHRAMASARVMGTCMGMGQVVGIAAALAIEKSCSPKEIDINELKERILAAGGSL